MGNESGNTNRVTIRTAVFLGAVILAALAVQFLLIRKEIRQGEGPPYVAKFRLINNSDKPIHLRSTKANIDPMKKTSTDPNEWQEVDWGQHPPPDPLEPGKTFIADNMLGADNVYAFYVQVEVEGVATAFERDINSLTGKQKDADVTALVEGADDSYRVLLIGGENFTDGVGPHKADDQ